MMTPQYTEQAQVEVLQHGRLKEQCLMITQMNEHRESHHEETDLFTETGNTQ